MKSTGIVRKIDELGRIVIPKEIRNVLSIHSNDDLEIFIDNTLIELIKERKKHESINKETINKISGYFVIYPIIVESDILGLLIFAKETVFTNEEKILTNIILKLIENR